MSLTRLLCLSLVVVVVSMASANPWTPEARTELWWNADHEILVKQTRRHGPEIEVLFLGGSFISNWAIDGYKTWDDYYAQRHAFNYGIDDDQTQNVLWRIENGEFEKLTPKLVVLMIGYSNVRQDQLSTDIAKGVETIVQKLKEKLAKTKILLLSVLPINWVHLDTKVQQVNLIISKFADNKVVFYHDLTAAFEISLGNLKKDLFNAEQIKLTELGYKIWYNETEETFDKLLK